LRLVPRPVQCSIITCMCLFYLLFYFSHINFHFSLESQTRQRSRSHSLSVSILFLCKIRPILRSQWPRFFISIFVFTKCLFCLSAASILKDRERQRHCSYDVCVHADWISDHHRPLQRKCHKPGDNETSWSLVDTPANSADNMSFVNSGDPETMTLLLHLPTYIYVVNLSFT
jgi:hypothetical protein